MNELILYSLLALIAGTMLNLMPCVLPVMPFKIQAVLREIKSDLPSRILAGLALLAGSLGFFLLLGLLTMYLGLIWGEVFQSMYFLGALSVFLLFAGIATFANWSVRLPQILYHLPAHRYLGAALTGVLAGILSTPCSGPFLGSVLAFAVTQSPAQSMVVFLSIGLGLALPYFILLTWPGLMDRLSFSGPWVLQIKHVLAFTLLAGSVFFSSPLVPAMVTKTGWVALSTAIMLWAIYYIVKFHNKLQRVLTAGLLVIAVITLTSVTGMLKFSHGEIRWQPYQDDIIHQAAADGRPVMIEFTADWCLNCKVLEQTVYKSRKVLAAALATGLIPLRVDLTNVSEENKALLTRYKGIAIPYVALLDRKGVLSDRFTGIFKAQTLADAITQAGQ